MSASIWNPSGTQSVPALPSVAPVTFVKGSAAVPGINFVGDSDTGVWSQADGYINFTVNGTTVLTIDPTGNIIANKFVTGAEIDIASNATCDIGAQITNTLRITGTSNISSFGTNYRGPIFIRFAGALTLAHNATSLILPGANNIAISAGDTLIATPKAAAGVSDGWVVLGYSSPAPLLNAVSAITGVTAGMPVANVSSMNGGQLGGMRNRIINGDMRIDQRNAGTAVTPATSTYLVDRWLCGGGASKLTFQQVADAPPGFKYSTKISVASQYAPASTDSFGFVTRIEGQNIVDMQFGLAGAATLTLSSQIKGSVAGTYAVAFRNSASNRSYIGTVTVGINWAPVKITFTADTTGTWLTDNGVGLDIWLDLGSGANFNAAAANTWSAGNFVRTAGTTTFVNQTAGSTLNITGVQLEVGTVATTFEQRPYSMELGLCSRYYYTTVPTGTVVGNNCGLQGHS